jgi:hypothetical protein
VERLAPSLKTVPAMTTQISRTRSASFTAIAALLAAFIASTGASARAADDSAAYLPIDEIDAE